MILQWMRYTVLPERRTGFERTQASWSVLIEAAGFIARFGGWREGMAETAALWQNEATYKRFLDYLHDPIERSSHQAETYISIETQLARSFIVLPDDLQTFSEVLNTAGHFLVTPAALSPDAPAPSLQFRARHLDDPHLPLNLYLWDRPAPGSVPLEPAWTVLVPRA